MSKSQFTIGAFAIILDENQRVLLCHRRDRDMWNLPGGALEDRESPWDAVLREVKEEVGIEVEVIKLQGVYSKTYQNDLVFSFLCRHVSGDLTLSDEADEINYFPVDQLPKNMSPRQVQRIRDALSDKQFPLMQIQSKE